MKRFIVGFLLGTLLTAGTAVLANQHVRLFVDGQEISFPEAPPQIINNRTMVPARPLAEALGATVEWDSEGRQVLVTQGRRQTLPEIEILTQEQSDAGFRLSPSRMLAGTTVVAGESEYLQINRFRVIDDEHRGLSVSPRAVHYALASLGYPEAVSSLFRERFVSVLGVAFSGHDLVTLVNTPSDIIEGRWSEYYIPITLLNDRLPIRFTWDADTKTLTVEPK